MYCHKSRILVFLINKKYLSWSSLNFYHKVFILCTGHGHEHRIRILLLSVQNKPSIEKMFLNNLVFTYKKKGLTWTFDLKPNNAKWMLKNMKRSRYYSHPDFTFKRLSTKLLLYLKIDEKYRTMLIYTFNMDSNL